MATLSKTAQPDKWSTTGVAMTMTASAGGGGDTFAAAAKQLIVVHNTNVATKTFTLTSNVDVPFGRTGDVSAQDIAADEIRVFIIPKGGWAAADGNIDTVTNSVDILIGIMDIT